MENVQKRFDLEAYLAVAAVQEELERSKDALFLFAIWVSDNMV